MFKQLNLNSLTPEELAAICDYTFLDRPEGFRRVVVSGESAVGLWGEALDRFLVETAAFSLRPYSVCVRAEICSWVVQRLGDLGYSGRVIVAVGFPEGGWIATPFKVAEARYALKAGASEVDMVLNFEAFKRGDIAVARDDVMEVCRCVHDFGGVLKLILEVSELTDQQIRDACLLATECGVDFVKTSTGFSASSATVEALTVMREHFDGGIKISGGVTLENVEELLLAAGFEETGADPMRIRVGSSVLLKQLCEG